jgi:hypothetical protein
MATANDETPTLLNLTDCLYFTNGSCMFKNKCRYRHCLVASKQLAKCSNWPDSCRKIDCPYRHTGVPSKTPKSFPQEKGLVVIFWDIENVAIPKGQRPFDIVQRIRQKLVIEPDLQEAAFSCYCNCNTIPPENQQSLSLAAVRIVHVPIRKDGAADREILLDLDRFERTHRPPATIVLISGDIDFVGKLSDLRHHAGYRVIVIHNKPAKEELKATVNAHYPWELFTEPSQQQQLGQPIIRNNSERLTNQSANFGRVLNNQLNNDCNVNPTASPKLKQPSIPPKVDLLGENNPVHNNYLETTSPTPYRHSGSVIRNHDSRSRTERLEPPITQLVNQTPASNATNNTPPSVPASIVASRARIRQAVRTNSLQRPNNPISGSCEQIPALITDDTAKIHINSLPCPHCTNEFSTIKALRQHQKDKNHLFDCPRCKEGFPTLVGLNQHQLAKGHNVSNNMDDQSDIKLDTTDNLNTNQSATSFEHNFNTSNNNKRLPVYRSPIANYSVIRGNRNNVNYVTNDED